MARTKQTARKSEGGKSEGAAQGVHPVKDFSLEGASAPDPTPPPQVKPTFPVKAMKSKKKVGKMMTQQVLLDAHEDVLELQSNFQDLAEEQNEQLVPEELFSMNTAPGIPQTAKSGKALPQFKLQQQQLLSKKPVPRYQQQQTQQQQLPTQKQQSLSNVVPRNQLASKAAKSATSLKAAQDFAFGKYKVLKDTVTDSDSNYSQDAMSVNYSDSESANSPVHLRYPLLLGRYEMYDTFGCKYYSLNKIKDVVDQFKEDSSITLDFTGMEQMTDTVFSVLFMHKVSRFSTINSVILDGCIHITDQGLSWIADCFEQLEKISLKGLSKVTESGLHELLMKCSELKTIDLTGTDVCVLSKLITKKNAILSGCSLVSPDRNTLEKSASKLTGKGASTQTVENQSNAGFTIFDEPNFSKPIDKEVVRMCIVKARLPKRSLLKMIVGDEKIPDVCVNAVFQGHNLTPGITTNIFECHESVLDLFVTRRTLYILPYELADSSGIKAVAELLYGYISYILSKVRKAVFLIVSVTDGKSKSVPPIALEKAINEIKQKSVQVLESRNNTFLNPMTVMLNPFELSLVDFDKQKEYAETYQLVDSLQNLKLHLANFNITNQMKEGDILHSALVEGSKVLIGLYPEYNDLSRPLFDFAVSDKIKEMLKDGVLAMGETKSSTQKMMQILQIMGKTICYQFAGDVAVVFSPDWLVALLNVVMAIPSDGRTNDGLISCVSDNTPIWRTDVLEKALGAAVPESQVKSSLQILSRLGLGHHYKVFVAFNLLEPQPPVPLEHYFSKRKDDNMLSAAYIFTFTFIIPPPVIHRIMYIASQIRRPVIAWDKGMVLQESLVEVLIEEKCLQGKSTVYVKAQICSMKMEAPPAAPSKIKKAAVKFASQKPDTNSVQRTCRLVEMLCYALEQFKLVVDYALKEQNLSPEVAYESDHPKPTDVRPVLCRHKMDAPNPENKCQVMCVNCGITPRMSRLLWFMFEAISVTSSFIDKCVFPPEDSGLQKGNVVEISNIFRKISWNVVSMMTAFEHNVCQFTVIGGSARTLKLGIESPTHLLYLDLSSGIVELRSKNEDTAKVEEENNDLIAEGKKKFKSSTAPQQTSNDCLWKIPILSFDISLGEVITFQLSPLSDCPAKAQWDLLIWRGREQISKMKIPMSVYKPCCEYVYDPKNSVGTASAHVLIHGLNTESTQKMTSVLPGMKLEALDHLNPHLICVATIEKITDDGKLLIHFDGWTSKYDYLTEPDSPNLHPIGFMSHHGHTYRQYNSDLQEPKGYTGQTTSDVSRHTRAKFQWETYLQETNSLPVPYEFFTEEQLDGTPPDKESEALRKLGIEDDTKLKTCIMIRNRSKVLEHEIMNCCQLSYIVDFFASHDKFLCLLPKVFNQEQLFYPSIRSISNLKEQNYHLLCPGLKMELLHFLNHAGMGLVEAVGQHELSEVFQNMAPYLELCFLGLMIQECVLPSKIEKLCQGLSNVVAEQKEKLEFHMKKVLLLYLSFLHLWNDSQGKSLLHNLESASTAYMPLQMLLNKAQSKEDLTVIMSGLDGSSSVKCVSHSVSISVGQNLSDVPLGQFQLVYQFIRKLDFSDNQIGALDEDFFSNFFRLEELNLSNNALKEFKSTIGPNSVLSYLDLSHNKISKLPDSFIALKSCLTYLNISHNPLTEMPSFVWELTKLVQLYADDIGKIFHFEKVKNLKELHILSLGQNVLESMPDELGSLKLVELNLSGIPWFEAGTTESCLTYTLYKEECTRNKKLAAQNGVEFDEKEFESSKIPRFGKGSLEFKESGGIPPVIFQLKSLQKLNLSFQCIRNVPDMIKELSALKSLDVSSNPQIESLSAQLGSFSLKELHLKDCPMLKTPPKEIVDRGFASVFGYLKRLQLGSVPCKRTKLMLVGLGGAGKTSLVRALTRSVFRSSFQQDEMITDGIDIENWEVEIVNEEPLVYSVWDFAGQTVYYNTHQFFLSNRAVYLLLWNIRLGYDHAGLDFWLNSIACHAPKAPILVVGTHLDKVSKAKIPTEELQSRYSQISAFHYVSSYSGKGVDSLKESLLKITLQQKYMGERIPEAWLSLEKKVISHHEEENVNLLPWKQMEKIANACGIFEGSELIEAVQFLHDLGSVQFYNTDFLRSYVVICPQWIVDVMRCIVTVHVGPIQEGKLLHKDMAVVWKDYPENIRPWLLRLTEEFDLTFPLTDEAANLVPCLLPTKKPKIDWPVINHDSGIRESKMLYLFQYLPAGLFNRAQVRLHEFSEGAVIWKKGSFLKKNDSHIALLVQTGISNVLVKCQGIQPENFLFLVHQVFETLIAESYAGVQYDYQIPCMECLEMGEIDPSMIPASKIQRAVQFRAPFLQCDNFHNLAIPDLKASLPPHKLSDFDDHLRRNFDDLHGLMGTISLFFCFSKKNIPGLEKEHTDVHPGHIMEDLRKNGYKVSFTDTPETENVESLTVSFKKAQIVLFGMSDEFCSNEKCHDLITYTRDTLRKPILLVLLGSTKLWQDGDLGLALGDEVFVSMQDISRYQSKLVDLVEVIQRKVDKKKKDLPRCFLSYCWSNSKEAVEKGSKPRTGSIGWGDPRKLKVFLESKNISCWLDIERVGAGGLYNDIADGLRKAKMMICCVSNEYAESTNCKMEFLFALNKLRIPVVLAVVGTGYEWEQSEIGVLSVGQKCSKVNFQLQNEAGLLELLNFVQKNLPTDTGDEISKQLNSQRQIAFKEVLEMVQRKFLWHIAAYSDSMDTTSYPRLFVVDLTDSGKPGGKRLLVKRMSSAMMIRNLEQRSGQEDLDCHTKEDVEGKAMKEEVLSTIPKSRYCFRLLCEYEEGWHDVSPSISFPELSPLEEEVFILKVAPYAARILAVLKHTDLQLACLTTPEGERLQKTLEEACVKSTSDFSEEYKLLRQSLMEQDTLLKMGGLNRCHLANGKTLWLCDKHKSVVGSKTEDRYKEELGFHKEAAHIEQIPKIIKMDTGSENLSQIKEEIVLDVGRSTMTKPTVFPSTQRQPPELQRQTSQACSVM